MKRIRRTSALAVLYSAAALAQQGVGGGSGTNFSSPANIVWLIVAVIGGMATGFFALSLIWTSIQGAFVDHDQFHKLGRIFFWAAICFSATFLAVRMSQGG